MALLLTSSSKINIWPKTDELFSFLLFGWRFSYDFFIFRDIACEDSQDLTNDWQEDQKLPWSRSEVNKWYEEQKLKIWWNLILWTTSLPSTWPKVFSQKLVWSGEIHYTNIVVLDLFWRWEVKLRFLRNDAFHCVFIRLHGNSFSNLKKRNLSHKLSTQTTR